MSLNKKLIVLIVVPLFLSIAIGIIVSAIKIREYGNKALEDKSNAILSRMEAVRSFIANQGVLDSKIHEIVEKYPNGLTDELEKNRIMNLVPIAGSWKVGRDNAEADHYTFRIAAINPRNQENKATEKEIELINKFRNNKEQTISYIDKETNSLYIMRPVFLKENEGCLKCHGNQDNSPFKNGKDVLGYNMENMKDGDFKAMFIIISDREPIIKQINSAILNIVLWGIFIGIIASFIAVYYSRKITGFIKQIKHISQKMATGDLRTKVEIQSNDELGELALNINNMIDSLNNILTEISNSAELLSNSTLEISQSSNIISKGAQIQASQFEELASAVQNTATSAVQASSMVKNTVRNTEQAGNKMNLSTKTMHEIEESAKKINHASQIISEIAFQINLLALNAGVEAARAGIHGKGFAVVASEVKKLAERTSNSAKEISEIMRNSLKKVEDGVKITFEAGEDLKKVIEDVNKTAEEISTISYSTNEQSKAMDQSTGIISSNASSAQELAASADSLAEQANQFRLIVMQFKLNKS